MTSPYPRPRSRGVWGTEQAGVRNAPRQQCSGRYEDRVLASPSMEGMSRAPSHVRVARGWHVVGHAQCINGRSADQAWGRQAANRIAERLHNFCVLA
jgi:hypothetical protein